MVKKPGSAIVWFRQDLRLHDNPALTAAVQGAESIIPLYILDDEAAGAWAMGGAARWWLHHSLASLSRDLRQVGATLILRRGGSAHILAELAETTGAQSVHAGIAHEPFWRETDQRVAAALEKSGRRLVLHRTATLIDPDKVRTKTGGIYGMYTPFSRAVLALGDPPPPEPAPRHIHAPPKAPAGDTLESWKLLPTKPDWATGFAEVWTPGEGAARARLQRFLRNAVERYATGRNLPGEDGTSMLSPHLHFGEISPRAVWHGVRDLGTPETTKTFLGEIIWRDFSAYLLWHNPSLPEVPLRPAFAKLGWRNDEAGLAAWERGRTGVPIVDAGLRQLWQTGWMHNRVRMIAASFLVKHLLISWQQGSAWFWDTLVDADLASNAASWQWVAGTGIDAQPFFRVFNPVTQGEKFDADGGYVRRYVPELASLPDKYLHAPWDAPAAVLQKSGVVLGKTYPKPVVDLARGRLRALDTYRRTVRAGRS